MALASPPPPFFKSVGKDNSSLPEARPRNLRHFRRGPRVRTVSTRISVTYTDLLKLVAL